MNKSQKNNYSFIVSEGIRFAKDADFDKSEKNFLKAIDIEKDEYEAYINLSNIYILQNKKDKCIKLLINYLLKNNFNENIANHAAKLFYNYKFYDSLLSLFKITKLDTPNYFKEKRLLYFIQGNFFEKNEDFKKAKSSYLKSINCDKYFFNSYKKLLNLLESTNDLKKLRTLIDDAFKIFENKYQIGILNLYKSLLLNREKKFKDSQNIISITNLNIKLKNDKFFYSKLLDLESKNLEKLKNYNEAYKKVEERNNFIFNLDENKKYSGNKILETMQKYKKFYTKKNIAKIVNNLEYQNDESLVFLVGFPRSGTTLLDTILRTHSKIKVLEEKPYLIDLRHNYFNNKNNDLLELINITQKERDYIRNEYFKKIIESSEDKKKIIIDKLPLSMIELGFIKCIFPKSKIILAMRHPCDVIISCFFSSFKINDAMVNFLKWEDALTFYDRVLDLFEFYEDQLDLNYFTIKYENVVNDFSLQIKNLINFLGLEYENKLEEFYITAKKRTKISTPSYSQVINPLYSSSINRWKNYNNSENSEKYLEKWINKFDY